MSILPIDAAERKRIPVFSGFMAYFPRAIAEVAKISFEGNEQHHAGSPLHWDKSKSSDHLDAQARHMLDSLDGELDQIKELAKNAWRAMAELETRLEQLPNPSMILPIQGIHDAGEFTQPPNCSPGVSDVANRLYLSTSTDTSEHPMAAEGLRLADEQPCNQPSRNESAWAVTWPGGASSWSLTQPGEVGN